MQHGDTARGRYISQVMKERRVTKLALAAELGIHRNTLDRRLKGQESFTLTEADVLVRVLEIDPRNLFFPPTT